MLAELNRFGEAAEEMAVVVAKRTAAEGPDDAATLHDRTQLAVILDALDRYEASEVLWRELAESKARVLGTGHPDAILARSRLAIVLYRQGLLQESAAEHREVLALRTAALGADHPDTKKSQDWIAVIARELEGPRRNDEN